MSRRDARVNSEAPPTAALMSRTLGPVAHQAFVYPDFEATLRALAAHGNPMQVVQEFSDPTSGRTFEIYCEPLGVKNPLLFQLMRADLFDAWFEAMHEIARNWDGSEPIGDALALMGGVVAKSAGLAPRA